ncbi:methyltransferase family protein [Mycolicibacter minnesotensis]
MTMAALVLYVTFAVLGFGWRSWVQYRSTGSTGFRGIGGRAGSLEWLAGVGFAGAVVGGLAAPALQLAGVITPIQVLQTPWLQAAGTVLAVAGIAATVYSQRDMGESWRIGVDSEEATALVSDGVFAWVRNPIFTAMLIFAAGIALMTPNPLALVAFGALWGAIELQVRVVEEPYLARVHGDAYRRYCADVGRFLPGIGIESASKRAADRSREQM